MKLWQTYISGRSVTAPTISTIITVVAIGALLEEIQSTRDHHLEPFRSALA